MTLWTEVWTRPGDAAFGRVIDDPIPTQAGFHLGLNQIGDGNMSIPDSFDRFDDILFSDPAAPGTSVSSLVRVFSEVDPTTPIAEWIPNSLVPAESKADATVDIGGIGINGILGFARLEPYDWDGSNKFDPISPDWIWGGTNLLINPGFENKGFPNGGFEEGNTNYWQLTEPDGFLTNATNLTAVENAALAHTGNWYGLVNPGANPKSGAYRTFSGLVVGEVYTITGRMLDPTSSGDRWRAGVSGAETATHTNAYEEDGYWWAEVGNATQGNGASDGTWQLFTITFVAGETSVSLAIIYDDPGPGPDFRLDTWNLTGDGVGLFPWEARATEDLIDIFEISTTTVLEGVQSCRFQGSAKVPAGPYGFAGFNYPGISQDVTLVVGKTYTLEAWVYQASGVAHDFTLSCRRKSGSDDTKDGGTSIMFRSGNVSVPTATWTLLTCTGVSDVTDAEFRLNWKYGGALDSSAHQSPIFFIDQCALYEGLAPTTVGDILTLLYEHAINPDLRQTLIVWDDGSATDTPYLTLDFDDALDSDGIAWDRDDIQVRLTMRMSYSQIMAEFVRNYGYEYRIVPDDVEAGTWLWQVYNPAGMSVDHTAAVSPAIQGGANDIRRGIRRFLPGGSDSMVEGQGRTTGRARNNNLINAIGRIESARLDRELTNSRAAQEAASEGIDQILDSTKGLQYTVAGDLQAEPLSAYQLGDLLIIEDPPEVSALAARFVDVVCSYTPASTEFDIQFGAASVTEEFAAVSGAVATLLKKFDYPDEVGNLAGLGAGGEGGGAPTIFVVAADASDFSKALVTPGFLCPGSGDHDVIQAACDALAVFKGRVLFSEGGFFSSANVAVPTGVDFEGMGRNASFLYWDGPPDISFAGNNGIRFLSIREQPGG